MNGFATAVTDVSVAGKKSYGEAMRSSALIGASSFVSVCLGIVRTKAMALLLGPAGIGLLGLYTSIVEVTRNIAGMGINSSGVRQIAEAVGSGSCERLAYTVKTLRRVAFCSGALGSLLLLLLSKVVSRLTFGDERHSGAIALLALAVFFGDISAAQAALVQGMRRIADLARMSVLGALYGTVLSIVIVYLFGEKGLVPSLVCVGAMSILTSWWYARRIRIQSAEFSLRQTFAESSDLLKLGFVFMISGLMMVGSAYVVRVIILRRLGVEAAGFYQAAWALGGLYVGFILQAMGADFYPRLTAVAKDNAACNRLVNEQAEVSLLLAGPGVIATLVFAPLVIQIFYSGKFGPALEVLRWFCFGMMLRVATWPMGFIVLAKGARAVFLWSEVSINILQLALAFVCIQLFGLRGAGISFCGMNAIYCVPVYLIVRRLSGFVWSAANRRLGSVFAPLITGVFLSWYVLLRPAALVFGATAVLASSIYSLKHLSSLVTHDQLPASLQKRLALLGIRRGGVPTGIS
jgi:enterobacterial common antigen flippase